MPGCAPHRRISGAWMEPSFLPCSSLSKHDGTWMHSQIATLLQMICLTVLTSSRRHWGRCFYRSACVRKESHSRYRSVRGCTGVDDGGPFTEQLAGKLER